VRHSTKNILVYPIQQTGVTTMAKTKTSVRVRPLYDRVLVRRLDAAEEFRGGIIIPDTAKEKPLEAEIMAVGDGKRLDDGTTAPLAVSVGDTVLIGKYSGTEIKVDDVEYMILREDEILGIIG
jgi:chaperonin GroES